MALILYKATSGKKPRRNASELGSDRAGGGKKGGRGNVDELFWIRIKKLVKIVLPSYTCKEARYIYVLTALLVVRTLMSIWLADVNGRVVKAIVNKSFPEFLQKVSHRSKSPNIFVRPCVDFQTLPFCCAFFYDQLGNRLHPEEVGVSVPQAPDDVLPRALPQEHALLQDLQLGQPHSEPGPETDARRRKVGLLPLHSVHQPGQTHP